MDNLTQQQLKELLHYDPDTGIFTWKIKPSGPVNVGDIAGCLNYNNYIVFKINKKMYRAHRLAFLYMEGQMPVKYVDHINRNPSDNRWCNLRHASPQTNAHNRDDNNKLICVAFRKKNNKWEANGNTINRKCKYLGQFDDWFEAVCARKSWEAKNNWTPFN